MKDIEWKSALPVTVSIFTNLTTDERHWMEVCYAFHCIDFHRTHSRSTTLHGRLPCLSLYRFSPNSQRMKDIEWKSATPFTVPIFTELRTDERHWMEVCHSFHYIDIHRTHNRWKTLNGSLLCLSLYRFSPNSQQINDTTWKSSMPFTVSIFTELSTDESQWMEDSFACHCIDFH